MEKVNPVVMTRLWSIFDEKAHLFGPLFVSATEGLAERFVMEICADPASNLAKFPSDFKLYDMGSYNQVSGLIVPLAQPVLVKSISQYAKPLTSVSV